MQNTASSARNSHSLIALMVAFTALVSACAPMPAVAPQATSAVSTRGLVGAWQVAVARQTGPGVVLLTFTSDGKETATSE